MKKLLAAVLALSGMAMANSITTNAVVVPSSHLTDFTYTATFQQFNKSLGTLTGIEFILNGTIYGTFTFTNNNQIFNGHVNSNSEMDALITLGNNVVAVNPTATLAGNGYVNGITVGAHSGVTTNMLTASASSTSALLTTLLSQYIGNGTFTLNGFALGEYSSGGSSNVNANPTTLADISAQAIYTYDAPAVPEPASMMLLGTGLLSLGALRYKLKLK